MIVVTPQPPFRIAGFDSRRLLQLLLLAVCACAGNYARFALGPLQEALALSLSLTDTQMAWLQGTAMALPMAICAVPVGMAIDRYGRVLTLRVFVALTCVSIACASLAHSLPALMCSSRMSQTSR